LDKFHEDGTFTVKHYGTGHFRPSSLIGILPYEEGRVLDIRLDDIRHRYRSKQNHLKADFTEKVEALLAVFRKDQ
jgi:hypothetical protein